jgi:hypothetical protein
MSKSACHHQWAMTNIRPGYLVIEGCFHCRNRISFFSDEAVAPIDDYHEGEHFWSHLAHYQASQFDLRCEKCATEVPLKEVMALMLCTKCDPKCGVYAAATEEPGKKTWVYAALCANTSHSPNQCISKPSLVALNEYFNQGIKDPAKKIKVVPCSLRKSVDTCQGIVLADFGLTDLY